MWAAPNHPGLTLASPSHRRIVSPGSTIWSLPAPQHFLPVHTPFIPVCLTHRKSACSSEASLAWTPKDPSPRTRTACPSPCLLAMLSLWMIPVARSPRASLLLLWLWFFLLLVLSKLPPTATTRKREGVLVGRGYQTGRLRLHLVIAPSLPP